MLDNIAKHLEIGSELLQICIIYMYTANAGEKSMSGKAKDFLKQSEKAPKISLWREFRKNIDNSYFEQNWKGKLYTNLEVGGQLATILAGEFYQTIKHRITHTFFRRNVTKRSNWLKRHKLDPVDLLIKLNDTADEFHIRSMKYGKEKGEKFQKFISGKADKAREAFVKSGIVERASKRLKYEKDKIIRFHSRFVKGFKRMFGIHEPTPEELEAKKQDEAIKEKEKQEQAEKKAAEDKASREYSDKLKEHEEAEKAEKKESEKEYEDLIDDMTKVGLIDESGASKAVKKAIKGVDAVGNELDYIKKRIDKSAMNTIRRDQLKEIARRRFDKTYDIKKEAYRKAIKKDREIAAKLKYRADVEKILEQIGKIKAAEEKTEKDNGPEKKENALLTLGKKTLETIDKIGDIKNDVENVYNNNVKPYVTDITNLANAVNKITEKPKDPTETNTSTTNTPKKVTVNKTAISVINDFSSIIDSVRKVAEESQNIKEGKKEYKNLKNLRDGLTSFTSTMCSYAGIDLTFAKSFNTAVDKIVELSEGESKDATETLLGIAHDVTKGINEYEKAYEQAKTGYVVSKGKYDTPVNVLYAFNNVVTSMNKCIDKYKIKKGAEDYIKNVQDANNPDAKEALNGAEDIANRMDLERFELIGNMTKSIATTVATYVSGGAAVPYVNAGSAIISSMGRLITNEISDSIHRTLSEKDLAGDKAKMEMLRERYDLRSDDADRVLKEESNSVDIKHLADKARLDIACKMILNKDDEKSEFNKLATQILGRKPKTNDILGLFGFKDIENAKKMVADRLEDEKPLDMKKEMEEKVTRKKVNLLKEEEERKQANKRLHSPNNRMKLFDDMEDEKPFITNRERYIVK